MSPRSPTRWTLVLALVGAGVVAAFQIGKAPAALPAVRAELGLDLFTASWVISIFNAIGLVAGMLIGGTAERLGHRRVAIGGLALIALASAIGAAAPGAVLLLASRVVEGAGVIAVAVSIPTLIVRAAAPGDLKLAMGMWSAYMPAGTGSMMAFAPLLLASLGWRGLWLANALLAAGFALALARATRALPVTPPPGGSFAAAMHATIAAPGPRLLALSFATYALQFLAVFGLLPTLLVEQDRLSPAAAALLGAIAIACNVPGNLLGGWLLHRGAPRWALIAATSAAMGALAIAIYAADLALPLRFALLCLLSLVAGITPAAVLGAAPSLAPSARHVALTNGLILQGSYLGQTIGPPAVAAIAQATGAWHWSPAVLCASAALGVALALALRPLEPAR
jgi:MFS family permease